MKDPALLIAVLVLIGMQAWCLYWNFIKPTTPARIINIGINIAVIIFLSYGLYLQDSSAAVFVK